MRSRLTALAACATAAGAALAVWPTVALAAARDLGERTPVDLGSGAPATQAASGGGGFGRTLLGLAVVVALIYGLYWALRRFKLGASARAHGTALSQLAALPLGPGKSLHLVRVGREVVLVAASERQVQAICRFRERDAAVQGLLVDEEPGSAPTGAAHRGRTIGELIDRLRQMTVRG